MRYRIHVSGSVLARNANTGSNDPAIVVTDRVRGEPVYMMARDVYVHGPSELRTRDGKIALYTDAEITPYGARLGLDPDQPEPPRNW